MPKVNKSTKQVCEFCQFGTEVRVCGRMWQSVQPGLTVTAHHKCMQYSAGLVQYKNEFTDFGNFDPKEVKKEVKRGNKLKCHICKSRSGSATAGCALSICPHSFHFLCAKQDPNKTTLVKKINFYQENEGDVLDEYVIFCKLSHKHAFDKKRDEAYRYVESSDDEAPWTKYGYADGTSKKSSVGKKRSHPSHHESPHKSKRRSKEPESPPSTSFTPITKRRSPTISEASISSNLSNDPKLSGENEPKIILKKCNNVEEAVEEFRRSCSRSPPKEEKTKIEVLKDSTATEDSSSLKDTKLEKPTPMDEAEKISPKISPPLEKPTDSEVATKAEEKNNSAPGGAFTPEALKKLSVSQLDDLEQQIKSGNSFVDDSDGINNSKKHGSGLDGTESPGPSSSKVSKMSPVNVSPNNQQQKAYRRSPLFAQTDGHFDPKSPMSSPSSNSSTSSNPADLPYQAVARNLWKAMQDGSPAVKGITLDALPSPGILPVPTSSIHTSPLNINVKSIAPVSDIGTSFKAKKNLFEQFNELPPKPAATPVSPRVIGTLICPPLEEDEEEESGQDNLSIKQEPESSPSPPPQNSSNRNEPEIENNKMIVKTEPMEEEDAEMEEENVIPPVKHEEAGAVEKKVPKIKNEPGYKDDNQEEQEMNEPEDQIDSYAPLPNQFMKTIHEEEEIHSSQFTQTIKNEPDDALKDELRRRNNGFNNGSVMADIKKEIRNSDFMQKKSTVTPVSAISQQSSFPCAVTSSPSSANNVHPTPKLNNSPPMQNSFTTTPNFIQQPSKAMHGHYKPPSSNAGYAPRLNKPAGGPGKAWNSPGKVGPPPPVTCGSYPVSTTCTLPLAPPQADTTMMNTTMNMTMNSTMNTTMTHHHMEIQQPQQHATIIDPRDIHIASITPVSKSPKHATTHPAQLNMDIVPQSSSMSSISHSYPQQTNQKQQNSFQVSPHKSIGGKNHSSNEFSPVNSAGGGHHVNMPPLQQQQGQGPLQPPMATASPLKQMNSNNPGMMPVSSVSSSPMKHPNAVPMPKSELTERLHGIMSSPSKDSIGAMPMNKHVSAGRVSSQVPSNLDGAAVGGNSTKAAPTHTATRSDAVLCMVNLNFVDRGKFNFIVSSALESFGVKRHQILIKTMPDGKSRNERNTKKVKFDGLLHLKELAESLSNKDLECVQKLALDTNMQVYAEKHKTSSFDNYPTLLDIVKAILQEANMKYSYTIAKMLRLEKDDNAVAFMLYLNENIDPGFKVRALYNNIFIWNPLTQVNFEQELCDPEREYATIQSWLDKQITQGISPYYKPSDSIMLRSNDQSVLKRLKEKVLEQTYGAGPPPETARKVYFIGPMDEAIIPRASTYLQKCIPRITEQLEASCSLVLCVIAIDRSIRSIKDVCAPLPGFDMNILTVFDPSEFCPSCFVLKIARRKRDRI